MLPSSEQTNISLFSSIPNDTKLKGSNRNISVITVGSISLKSNAHTLPYKKSPYINEPLSSGIVEPL